MVNGTPQTSTTWEVWVGARTASKASTSLGTVLDVNGDRYADVIVVASSATNTAGQSGAGRAHLYLAYLAGCSVAKSRTLWEITHADGVVMQAQTR
jgi:hypothetical protein